MLVTTNAAVLPSGHARDAAIPNDIAAARTVWVIDDDFLIGSALSWELELVGYEAIQLFDVDEVAAQQGEPGFVLLDVSLRGCDAVDVLQVLHSKNITAPIQILSSNALDLLDDIRGLGTRRGLNMLPVMRKPVHPEDVCGVVAREFASRALGWPSVSQAFEDKNAIDPVDLGLALTSDWLEVWYQPKYHLESGKIIGAECLSRVRHPERGIIPPIAFLSGAGASDIAALTDKVVRQACADWQAFAAIGCPIRLAVNVPGAFLTRLPLVKLLRECSPQSPQWRGLTLEITEEDALRDIDAAREISTQLKIYGVSLSIDDFGMGYSSLARLREIPFSEIKLDRSLVDGCADDVVRGALCRSVIDLAHSFGACAVAEGVEREADLAFLRSIRCDIAQGYFCARPMPGPAFLDLLGKE